MKKSNGKSDAPFKFWAPPLPRGDTAWAFCHIKGSATVGGRVIRGAAVEANEATGQYRFFAVPLRQSPTPGGSLTHAMSWIIAQTDFSPLTSGEAVLP